MKVITISKMTNKYTIEKNKDFKAGENSNPTNKELFDTLISKTDLTPQRLNELIIDKKKEMQGLIGTEGAIYIIANQLQVRLCDNEGGIEQ